MIKDDETRFAINKLEQELYQVKESLKTNIELTKHISTLVNDQHEEIKTLKTEIQILKDGGNI